LASGIKCHSCSVYGAGGRYVDCALTQTLLARELGDNGLNLLQWTTEGLEAWAHYAYDEVSNEIKPMLADGKDLTGQFFPRKGYYGKKGEPFIARPLPTHVILSYVTNWAVSRSKKLWPTVCAMAVNFDLGKWNAKQFNVNLETKNSDPLMLFAVLEMYKVTSRTSYLKLAEQIGLNIFNRSANRGLFTPSVDHLYCRFDDVEPLALLHLIAAKQGSLDQIPEYRSAGGYIHGDMKMSDGQVKNTLDIKSIYPELIDLKLSTISFDN